MHNQYLKRGIDVRVIPNGVDINEILEAKDTSLEGEEFSYFRLPYTHTITFVGRLSPEKNLFRLISAFSLVKSHFSNSLLLIIGDGPLLGELRLHAINENVENSIKFLGYKDNVIKFLKNSDALVIPSLSEGFPITLLEAMTVGTPVIATDVGDMAKALRYDQGGYVVRSSNEHDIADCILEVLKDPDQAKKRSSTSFQMVLETYSASSMTNKYHDLYSSINAPQKAR
jgi:glycosyltransferase involved in cell wall biosynthesis